MRRAVVALLVAGSAAAADLDLDLSRFVVRDADGMPVLDRTRVQTQDEKFYSLASELGVLFHPKFLAPAESLGYNGFALGFFQVGWTTISADEDFWDAAEVVEVAPDGTALASSRRPPSLVPTVGMFVRKGIWFPVPSVELGAGFTHLPGSSMFAIQMDAKLAINENTHAYLPDVAVRGSGARVLGTSQIDLTTAGLDFSVSKSFGVGGTANLAPYAGYQLLWIIANSEVLDATPGVDAFGETLAGEGIDPDDVAASDRTPPTTCMVDDCNANFVFFDPDPIRRGRFFAGFRMVVNPVSVTVEASFAGKGQSSDCALLDAETGQCADGAAVSDRAGSQQTYAAMLGLDF